LKKWQIIIIGLVFVATLALSVLTGGHHEAEGAWWHHVPGFYIILGFAGCVAFIVVSKWLGKHFLQRDDQYYEKR